MMKLILFVLLYAETALATGEFKKVTNGYDCGKGFERITSREDCEKVVKQLAVTDPNVRDPYYPDTPQAYGENNHWKPPYCYLQR